MDIGYLLRILARRKWLIFIAMFAAAVATFFFIGRKPERYKATVIMSTGIVNYKGINSDNEDAFVQQYQVENAFSNLIVFSRSRSSIKLLTIQMLRRDLLAEDSGAELPFRRADKSLSDFSDEERQTLVAELKKINLDSINDPSFDQQFDYLLDKIARAYGYDNDAILRGLLVRRRAATDYLGIEITTENPALSQHMANEYAKRFMTYYHNLAVREKKRKAEFLTGLAARRQFIVDSISEIRYAYLRNRGLPSIGKQSEDLIGQISYFEKEKEFAESKRATAVASVNKIDDYMNRSGARDAGETKTRIVDKADTDEQLERVRELTQQSLDAGGKDPEIEAELAEAKQQLQKSIQSSAKSIGKPKEKEESKRTKEDLYKERVAADLNRIDAEKTIAQVDAKIASLKGRLGTIVGDDEYSSSLAVAEERAREEFDKVNEQLIDARLDLSKQDSPLSIVENAQLPEWPEPNRQVLLSLFAAAVAGTLTMIALFLLAYMDGSLQSPELFKRYTGNLPLLGTVNTVPLKGLNLNQVFSTNGEIPKYTLFRESLRKIRTTLLQNDDDHIFLIVSLKSREGKTFAMHALAHSLTANHNRVLMLDTNFKTPLPEDYTDRPTGNSAVLNKIIRENNLTKVFQLKTPLGGAAKKQTVDIIGNHGLQKSPSEVFDPARFRQFLSDLREHYDYIFLESAALNDYSDAQELDPFVDKIIAVFNARSVIKPADKNALEYLRGLNGKFAGAVLTEVDERNLN
jgi:Mrp family chromosome partitioning ATPase/capsular polysaccharide biosynthesis protein